MNTGSGIRSAAPYCLFADLARCLTFVADVISGTVRNQTTGKAAAGDEVILLRLQNGMEENPERKTDVAVAFLLQLSAADASRIVRVLHQGVNYDQSLSGKGPLEIAVFDVVPRIRDLQGSLGIARVEIDGET